MSLLAPKMDKRLPFEKVQPQWRLLYLFFWEWVESGSDQGVGYPLSKIESHKQCVYNLYFTYFSFLLKKHLLLSMIHFFQDLMHPCQIKV